MPQVRHQNLSGISVMSLQNKGFVILVPEVKGFDFFHISIAAIHIKGGGGKES